MLYLIIFPPGSLGAVQTNKILSEDITKAFISSGAPGTIKFDKFVINL